VERVCLCCMGREKGMKGRRWKRRCEQSIHCYDLPALVEGISSFERLSLSSYLATHFNENMFFTL